MPMQSIQLPEVWDIAAIGNSIGVLAANNPAMLTLFAPE